MEGHSVPVSLTSVKSNIFRQIDSFLFSFEEFFQSTATGWRLITGRPCLTDTSHGLGWSFCKCVGTGNSDVCVCVHVFF